MEQNKKRTRKAVWRTCRFCEKRNIVPPFSSGKLKCLEKHMVQCEAAYILEQGNETRPKFETLFRMVEQLQKTVAEQGARIAVLEQKKTRTVDVENMWFKMSPKKCWNMRKKNTVRIIRACLSTYEPSKWVKTPWEYLQFNILPPEIPLSDILSLALWPVLVENEHSIGLRGIQTSDEYCLFKQIFGKSRTKGLDLTWYLDALKEVGAPLDMFYCERTMYEHSQEFERVMNKFQSTTKRSKHGLIGLLRIWRKVFRMPDEFIEVATSLRPEEDLKWEK